MSRRLLKHTFSLALVALAAGSAALAEVRIDAPIGGWRQGSDEAAYTQTVNYPASRVNLGGDQPVSAQIRGQITGAPKERQPATLVVNGTAMPLEVDEAGHFGRPYSFPAGSNSVEVRSPDGQVRRVQFYETNSGRAQARLRVVLSWDSPGTDLDLHLITPNGEHSWYGERVIRSGALDVDVTTGYGPEIFSSPAPARGNYQVYVNYYGSGEETQALTIAQVAIIFNEGTPDERRQLFRVPMRAPGELTLIRSFAYP